MADKAAVREADGSIKPGVERSETPGVKLVITIEPAKRPIEVAITKARCWRSTVGRSAGFE